MFIEIPDALPVLSVGDHKPGSGKACIMDAISIISGKPEQGDQPSCVHPMLRSVFIRVNDDVPDDKRHRLWPLGLRAMGTAQPLFSSKSESQLAATIYAHLARDAYRQEGSSLVSDHADARLVPLVVAWLRSPSQKARTRLSVLLQSGYRPCECTGCHYIRYAAISVCRLVGALDGVAARINDSTPDGMFVILGQVMDAFEAATGRAKPAPAPAPVVDWDTLTRDLGTVKAAT